MWLFIPVLIVLVLMFTVGAVVQGVFWLVGGAWPWLLIGLGAWMLWHQDGRHHRSRRYASTLRPSPAPPVSSGRSRPSAPRSKPRSSDLPIDVQVKVEQIRRKVDVLLGYADRFPPFSQDLHLVRQTASDYLPRTINTFLAMKPEDVDRPLASTGKTAREELKSQLDLLDSKLDDIAQDLQRQDADRLLANRRFLEARFGDREKAVS
jgi:hypothetical protein